MFRRPARLALVAVARRKAAGGKHRARGAQFLNRSQRCELGASCLTHASAPALAPPSLRLFSRREERCARRDLASGNSLPKWLRAGLFCKALTRRHAACPTSAASSSVCARRLHLCCPSPTLERAVSQHSTRAARDARPVASCLRALSHAACFPALVTPTSPCPSVCQAGRHFARR